MTLLTSLCEMAFQIFQKKQEEKQLEEEQAAKAQNWKLPVCYDDDDDEERSNSLKDNIISGLPPCSAITLNEPVLSIEEPDNSLSMGDEHLNTILETESDEFIKSSVENLIPIPCELEGIPDHMCDVPFHDNAPPLDVSKDQFEDFSESNDEFSSTDDDSFSIDKIDYVEASPPDSELIEALNDNPTPFYDPIISGTPLTLTPSGESDFVLEEVDAFLAVEDEPISSQFPQSDCVCSKGNVADKILVPELPKNCARCARCGHPVDGPYCQGCALLRQELEENLVTHSQDFQNTSELFNDSTNVFNAPREPFVVKQDHRSFVDKIICDLNRAPDSPHLHTISPNQFHCFHCKDVLGDDGILCKRCTYKSCGKDAHIGYNCPPKVSVISNPKPCKNQTNDELPQTLPNFHPTFHSGDKSPFTCDSTRNYIDESPNVFNPPPQPLMYSCEFCGNDAHYGHYCTPQAPFIYPEPCYNRDFNFPQDFHNFPQQYPCCDDCGVTHKAYQCQPKNHDYYNEQNSCDDSTSIGFDQSQPQQYTVNHPIFNAHNDYLDSQIKLNSTLTPYFVKWLVKLFKRRKKKINLKKSKRLKLKIKSFPFAMMMTRKDLVSSISFVYCIVSVFVFVILCEKKCSMKKG
nr:hypothetical protein [Tanacetum cinerariifolium]